MKMVFRVTPRQRLILVPGAVEQMQAFAQRRWWNAEAGGVLLGRHLLDSHDVVVDEVTTPQASDRRSRFSFFRSRRHETLARERGACKLTLEVLSGNAGAMRLYQRAGFAHYQLDPAMGQAGFMQKWLD